MFHSGVGDDDLAGSEGFRGGGETVGMCWLEPLLGPVSSEETAGRAAVHVETADYALDLASLYLGRDTQIHVLVDRVERDGFAGEDDVPAQDAADRDLLHFLDPARGADAELLFLGELGLHAHAVEVHLELLGTFVAALVLHLVLAQSDEAQVVGGLWRRFELCGRDAGEDCRTRGICDLLFLTHGLPPSWIFAVR